MHIVRAVFKGRSLMEENMGQMFLISMHAEMKDLRELLSKSSNHMQHWNIFPHFQHYLPIYVG